MNNLKNKIAFPPASLEAKVDAALAFLRDTAASHAPDGIALAFTGGKDSTVALHLWRLALAGLDKPRRPLVINLDTGCKFPEVMAFRDALAGLWRFDLRVIKSERPAGLEFGKDVIACCRALKVEPLLAAIREMDIKILLTGLRADENPHRADLSPLENHGDHMRLHPILNFTEMDIWAYVQTRELPYCDLYEKGYRSLGCMPCTNLPEAGGAERSGRVASKEENMDSLRALGYF